MSVSREVLLHSDTRFQAHEAIRPHKGRLHRIIIEHLQIHGPKSCEQMEEELELGHSTVSARLCELFASGTVIDCGRTVTRSGRACRLYSLPVAL